ncbi:AAA family ATPase [Vibrio genomosp. F10]|uniref:AAA family ATPase n=1 Tax=Vibrio genomosp. F10 TaxID=723171 RepID=UPI0002F758CF|nr:AAA family ATPase [Vibrio genomosp. F10]OEF04501.1 ATPase [Vibrio genomosp. F10 str. 9ZB36]
MKPFIISGGPGAGKTSIIECLASMGYCTAAEASRTLIEQQSCSDNGILPWTNLSAFAELCLALMTEQKQAAQKSRRIAFMDRAIPDICAYLKQGKLPIEQRYMTGCDGYQPIAFLCQPEWSIYAQDAVRPHPFEEALEIHEQLLSTYLELGFDVIQVPWGEIRDRAEFIENQVKTALKVVITAD